MTNIECLLAILVMSPYPLSVHLSLVLIPPGHLTVRLGPDHEVPVVGQDAVGQNADRVSLMRLDHHALKRLEVAIRVKEVHPADRSVQHVVDLASRGVPSDSWHESQATWLQPPRQYELRPECHPLGLNRLKSKVLQRPRSVIILRCIRMWFIPCSLFQGLNADQHILYHMLLYAENSPGSDRNSLRQIGLGLSTWHSAASPFFPLSPFFPPGVDPPSSRGSHSIML